MKTSSELKSWNVPRIQVSHVIGNQWVSMLQALIPYIRAWVLHLAASKEGRASRGHPAQEDQECP